LARRTLKTKSKREIDIMREAGAMVAECLRLIGDLARPGVTTGELDAAAEQFIRGQGAKPIFKGYRGFPATICASINEAVVHGIPGDRVLVDGDILSVDVGVRHRKYVGDAATTLAIAQISPDAQRLLDVCSQSLTVGIDSLRANMRLSTLCGAIQQFVESHGFSVVRKYTGHGIGRDMHEEPQIPNFVSEELLDNDTLLPSGTTLAIEPMVNAGGCDTEVLRDRWTVVTKDRSLSAHFEHTVAITDNGPDILTL